MEKPDTSEHGHNDLLLQVKDFVNELILLLYQVTLGLFGHEEEVISNPLSPAVIKDIIYRKCSPHGEREAVLQQELVIHIGWIISNSPELFSGMLKIRVG